MDPLKKRITLLTASASMRQFEATEEDVNAVDDDLAPASVSTDKVTSLFDCAISSTPFKTGDLHEGVDVFKAPCGVFAGKL